MLGHIEAHTGCGGLIVICCDAARVPVLKSLQKQLTELKRENTRLRSNAKQQRVAANNGQGNGGAAGRTWTDGPDAGRESNCRCAHPPTVPPYNLTHASEA